MRHYNNDLTLEQQKVFNLKGESSDPDVYDSIMPVVDVTPKNQAVGFVKVITRTTSGGVTAFTTDAVKETYLTSINYSFVKNVACDIPSGQLQVTTSISGANFILLEVAVLTLTAERDSILFTFEHPILLDKNVTVSITNQAFAAGNLIRTAVFKGFLI